jgi:hypothetical protein
MIREFRRSTLATPAAAGRAVAIAIAAAADATDG